MSQTTKSPKTRVAILDDYYDRAHTYANWSDREHLSVEFFNKAFTSEDDIVAALQGFSTVGLMRERTPFTRSLIERLPDLELIVTSGKKNASIDTTAALDQGITVCGTESPGHATAELAFLLMMSLSRQLVPLVNALSQKNQWQPVLGRDMRDQTLGILGLGRLGAQLAGFAQAMGMNVIAWSENLTQQHCGELGVEYVSREALFERGDIVSIHLRHSDRTHAMVGAEDLKRLGSQGYLVNTSRAEIVDLDSLKVALDSNSIAGAALDVYETEPTPENHWAVLHPRVLATPHIGYCTEETFTVFYTQMLESIEAYYEGTPIRIIAAP